MSDNNQFKAYVTSTAFSLSLSRNMIDMLLNVEYHNSHYEYAYMVFGERYISSLSRRGLVEVHAKLNDGGVYQRYAVLTQAGSVLCKLLRIAGFKYEPYDFETGKGIEKIPEPEIKLKESND